MPSPLKSIVSAFAALALLAGCTGGVFPERQVDPVPLLVADEPLWGLHEAPLTTVRFVGARVVLNDGEFMSVRDVETGKLIWRQGYDVEVVGGVGESYVSADDPFVVGAGPDAMLIVRFTSLTDTAGNHHDGIGYSGLMALSLIDGHLIWRSDTVEVLTDENLGATVGLVDANDEIALVQVYGHEPGNRGYVDYRLLALDVSDGSVRWSVPGVRGEYLSGDTIGVTLTGTAEQDFDTALTGNGVAVLDAATGAERWRLEAEDRKASAGNAHVIAMEPGSSYDNLELGAEIFAADDGTKVDSGEVAAKFCEASDELLACNDNRTLLVVDAEARAGHAELADYAGVVAVHGDRIFVTDGGTSKSPTVWTTGPTQVESNLPGTLLGQGEGYLAVGYGGEWVADVAIYRQVTGESGGTPAPTPLPPPDFTEPTDPSREDYRPPRPAPLAEPIILSEQLWQSPAARPSLARILGDSVVIKVHPGSADEPGQLTVLDAARGAVRWTLPDDAPLPGGGGAHHWNEYSDQATPLVLIDGTQPAVLVNYQTNSCGTSAADCQGPEAFTTGFGVAALSLADGSLVWRHAAAERTAVGPSDDKTFWNYGMAMLTGAADGVVVLTTQTEYYSPDPASDVITALAADSGEVLWTAPGLLAKAVTTDAVFAAQARGDYDEGNTTDTVALNLHTGEREWTVPTPGSWPIAATTTHVAVAEVTWGSAGELEIMATVDGALSTDLGSGHWDCATLPGLLACESVHGIKMVPDQGDPWLLNIPDEISAGSLDALQGERYFASSHGADNDGAPLSWMLDANGTPLGEPLPGRVLALGEELVVLLDEQQVMLYRYQG